MNALRLLSAAAGIIVMLCAGCTHPHAPAIIARGQPGPAVPTANSAQLQSEVMNLADDFVSAVADVYSDVESRAPTAQRAAYAQNQKTELASGALSNAVNPYPFAGMMDMVVLASLARRSLDDPSDRKLLGEDDVALVGGVLRSQEAAAWNLANRYLSKDQANELRALIAQWRVENPNQRFIAHVRLVDFLDAPSAQSAHRTPGSIFGLLFLDPMAGIDPAVRELQQSRQAAERIFFFVQRMPLVLSWQAEALFKQMLLAPQVERALDDVSRFSRATTQFADSAAQFTASLESLRQHISTERQESIDQLQRAVAAERDSAIRQATTQVTDERMAAISQMAASIRAEQEEMVSNMERSMHRVVDQFYSRMLALVVIAIIAGALAASVYRKIFAGGQQR